MATDLSNWNKKTGDEYVYQRVERRPFGDAANKSNQEINIDGNKQTGNYTVSATGTKLGGLEGFSSGTDIPIYSFDADQDKVTILNDSYFKKIFQGNNDRNDTFKKLNKQTKIDILSIAQKESETKNEINDLNRLSNLKSYESSSNVVNSSPQTITSGPNSSNNQSTFSKTNSAISAFDRGSDFRLRTIASVNAGDPGLQPTGSQYFRYPEGRIPNLGYDYIQITSYKYVPGLSLDAVKAAGIKAGNYLNTDRKVTRSSQILAETPENIIQLPMTGSLSDTTAVSWNSDTVSELNLIAGQIAYNNISTSGNPASAVLDSLMDVIKTGQAAIADADVKKQLMAYFAGQAASAPSFVQRATGKIINNNMELLFNGPTLRSFNFSFKLRPRSESESVLCRNIIKSLKRDSAPKTSKTNLFLETPNIFLIEYMYQAQQGNTPSYTQHPFLNKIKPCALTSININYTPDGSYMTYETNGSMIGYDLNLTFQEIEPVYRSDQEEEYTQDNMGF